MKQWLFPLAACLLCFATAHAAPCGAVQDAAALDNCLDGELEQKSRLAEQLARRAADARPAAERRQMLESFAEWRKSTLLACSIASQEQADALMREIRRKNCLIARIGERIYEDSRPLP
jgi:anti-sigma-K factor RskA